MTYYVVYSRRVSENRVLRSVFKPKRDGGWRKLHNKELKS
jgi:hypothetical protein